MMELNAIYASTEISKTNKVNPDQVVTTLIDEQPDASREELRRAYIERSRDDTELSDVNAETAFLYAYNRVQGYIGRNSSKAKGRRRKQQEDVKAEAAKHIATIQAVCVMDLVLPSGKQVRHSTFGECKAAGGLFMRLAAKGKPNQVVGKTLSDKQAQALWTGK